MDAHVAQELLNELGSSLENLETQQAALLRFLKDKGIVTDEELAPYLNEAGNASSVRWRAAHVRLEHIFAAAEKKEQQTAKPEAQPAATQPPRKQQRDREEREKPAEPDTKPAAKETAQAKEEKDETTETSSQASEGGAKTEREPGPRRREDNAA